MKKMISRLKPVSLILYFFLMEIDLQMFYFCLSDSGWFEERRLTSQQISWGFG